MITHFISIREPYDEWILSGQKKVETRTMRMPEKFIGKTIGIYVPEKKKIVGTIKVVGQVSYPDVRSFRAAYPDHLVAPGSPYDIKPGGKKVGLVLRFPQRIDPESPRRRVYPSMINQNPKDYCYRKIKKQYKVFPSAYASGAIVQCRRRLGSNRFSLEKKYGLRGWFMRSGGKGWIDCKTGLPCGRKEGEKRAYPACRPTRSMCSSAMRKKLGKKRISWVRKNPVPPAAVARVACRGLAKRRKYKRGGTAVGVARGRDLCNRRNVSMRTIRRLSSYFARHRASRAENAKRKSDPTSAAAIADDLWGGSPGWAWAKRVG